MKLSNYLRETLWLQYFSKILILIGMVLVFGGLGAFLSNIICLQVYGVDFTSFDFNSIKKEDANIIAALKVFQTLGGGIGMFLIPGLLFPKVINYDINTMVMYARKPAAYQILTALVLVFITIPAISWLYQINQDMKFPEMWSDFEMRIRAMENQAAALTKVFVSADTIPMLLLNIFVVALVPAICEEVFFRGILLQYTRYIFDKEWVAIIISSLVFSGFHGQFYGFLPRFALGIVLGFVFLKTASIYPPLILHFINNAMAVLMVYWGPHLPTIAIFSENYVFNWYWVILSFAASIGICYWLQWYFKQSLYTQFKRK
jgi:membrane protease YdiL (CAAX protease family)